VIAAQHQGCLEFDIEAAKYAVSIEAAQKVSAAADDVMALSPHLFG